jgi:hypothetical protein
VSEPPDEPGALVRASDAEREEVAGRLGRAVGEGRLTLSEFSDRAAAAYAARTRGELEPLVADLPATGTPAGPAAEPRTSWHVSPIGGLVHRGRWRLPTRTVSVSLIGGTVLDLADAEFAAPEVEMVLVSLVGGVSVRVPRGVRVEVDGFGVIGGHSVDLPAPGPGAPVLRLRCYSLIGGVSVRPTR